MGKCKKCGVNEVDIHPYGGSDGVCGPCKMAVPRRIAASHVPKGMEFLICPRCNTAPDSFNYLAGGGRACDCSEKPGDYFVKL